MIAIEPERCFVCKKLFCCADCCVNHIKNKHPNCEPKCPLCRYKPLTIRNFDNSEFLCHIVFHHLPLHCRTCGELFESVEDLKAIGICGQHPLIIIEPPTFIDSIKSLSINTPSPLNKTPSQLSSIDKKGISIINDYTNNFGNFTSPPELTRNTSTPMHIGIMKKNFNSKYQVPKIPNIILTTPSFSVKNNSSNNDDDISGIVALNSISNKKEFIHSNIDSSIKLNSSDKTPLKSILSMKSISSESSQLSHHSKNYSDNKLASMAEVNEDEIDMELTDVNGGVLTQDSTPPVKNNNISMLQKFKDAGKKVRFSDQCEINITNNKFDVSESEEFFDARQSLGEISTVTVDNFDGNNSLIKIYQDKNFQNSEKETTNNNSKDNSNDEKKKENFGTFINQQSKKSSRVVMMVLVEQTDGSNQTDLVPLIDSSLKKLGSVIRKTSIGQNNSDECNDEKTKAFGKFSLVSVDSYTSVSTVECFKAPDIETIPPKSQSIANVNHGGSGILSTVANAVRSVFRNWAGVMSTKNPTVLSTSSSNEVPMTSVTSTSDKSSNIAVNNTINSLNRRAKRSRDEVDLISVDSSETSDGEEAESNRQNDIRSPLQKRPCGWYRQIHGREPIARMKNSFSSPQSISSEKQRFQQGSLTIGDIVLPLPSRAHQSTQTD